MFSASYSSRAQEVFILIHKSILFQVVNPIINPKGRYIILQGILLYEKLNLVIVNGPNENDPTFFDNLFLTPSTPRPTKRQVYWFSPLRSHFHINWLQDPVFLDFIGKQINVFLN